MGMCDFYIKDSLRVKLDQDSCSLPSGRGNLPDLY